MKLQGNSWKQNQGTSTEGKLLKKDICRPWWEEKTTKTERTRSRTYYISFAANRGCNSQFSFSIFVSLFFFFWSCSDKRFMLHNTWLFPQLVLHLITDSRNGNVVVGKEFQLAIYHPRVRGNNTKKKYAKNGSQNLALGLKRKTPFDLEKKDI